MRTLKLLGTTVAHTFTKSQRLDNKCIKNMIKNYNGTDWKDVLDNKNIVKKTKKFTQFKYPKEFKNVELQIVKWNKSDGIDYNDSKSIHYLNRILYKNILSYIHNEDDKLERKTSLSKTNINCFHTQNGYHLLKNIEEDTEYSLHIFSRKKA